MIIFPFFLVDIDTRQNILKIKCDFLNFKSIVVFFLGPGICALICVLINIPVVQKLTFVILMLSCVAPNVINAAIVEIFPTTLRYYGNNYKSCYSINNKKNLYSSTEAWLCVWFWYFHVSEPFLELLFLRIFWTNVVNQPFIYLVYP